MSNLWVMSLGCEIIPDMQSKCINYIQRCKTSKLVQWSGFKFSTQLRNSTRNLSLNLYYYISVGIILCDKQILPQKELPYTLKSTFWGWSKK